MQDFTSEGKAIISIKLYYFIIFQPKIQANNQEGKHHIKSSIKLCIQMYTL